LLFLFVIQELLKKLRENGIKLYDPSTFQSRPSVEISVEYVELPPILVEALRINSISAASYNFDVKGTCCGINF